MGLLLSLTMDTAPSVMVSLERTISSGTFFPDFAAAAGADVAGFGLVSISAAPILS